MKDLREYPRTRYRRAWIVKNRGTAMQFNGQWCYVGWSSGAVGEVFFYRKDAEFVLKTERKMMSAIGVDPITITIQPVMVPLLVGTSEHVRTLKIMKAERDK